MPTPPRRASAPDRPEKLGGRALDRRAEERVDPQLLTRLLADSATRVLELREGGQGGPGTAPIHEGPDGPTLQMRSPLPADDCAAALFLGRDEDESAWVAVPASGQAPDATPTAADSGSTDGTSSDQPAAGPGERPDPVPSWSGLRDVGALLGPRDVDAYMTATALTNWHRTHQFCPRCGAATIATMSGWVRSCVREGTELYPRTDAAVIMAVIDPDDRLLLARNSAWVDGRRSVLAGFVEPGERLEAAVAREVFEEVGIVVDGVTYCDSQPWPFPASLMLGFRATARGHDLHVDADEIAEADWYSREHLAEEVAHGRLGLPGRLSIARRLIEGWYGETLTPPVELPFHRPS